MGLSLQVGILTSLSGNDDAGFEHFQGAFERLASFLGANGLPRHVEPRACAAWSADMLGYSGLHDLRRIAAHMDAGEALPEPARGDSPETSMDERLSGYYDACEGRRPSWFRRLFGRSVRYQRGFDHLMVHSDAEGFYLPFDFADVLIAPDALEIPGSMIGSAPRLLAELDRVAGVLEIPTDLSLESDELRRAVDGRLRPSAPWQRYGREAFGCVALREGCRHAMTSQAALVFT